MTHAVPPPRLPVRDRAALPDPTGGGGVSPMLTRLAAERATGVLEREHGTLHLADGHVVHAESPFAPGLADLLLAHGTLAADAWRQAVERADEEHGAGRLLVEAAWSRAARWRSATWARSTTPGTSRSPPAAPRAASTTAPATCWARCGR